MITRPPAPPESVHPLEDGEGVGKGLRRQHGDVAMAAAATTVYLTALLNPIQPITIRPTTMKEALKKRIPGMRMI